MDGVDGMAISGTVSISGFLLLVLLITNGPKDLILLLKINTNIECFYEY